MNHLQITQKENYAILQLDQGKVNALNQALINEIRHAIRVFEEDPAVRGIIITGKPHYFSAGLDIIELYNFDEVGSEAFWRDFLNLKIEMTAFSKPLMCAITGHSPAGGCVMAVASDYRVMADGEKYRIGLNEVAVGIIPSTGIFHLYAHWIGKRLASQYLMEGKMHSPQEALNMGLVDEICPLEEVLPRTEAKMQKWLRADAATLRSTKYNIRKYLIKRVAQGFEEMVEGANKHWWKPESRAVMQGIIDGLTKKVK